MQNQITNKIDRISINAKLHHQNFEVVESGKNIEIYKNNFSILIVDYLNKKTQIVLINKSEHENYFNNLFLDKLFEINFNELGTSHPTNFSDLLKSLNAHSDDILDFWDDQADTEFQNKLEKNNAFLFE